MKKILVFCVVLLTAQLGYSQIFTGGSLSFNSTFYGDGGGTYHNTTISPLFGFRNWGFEYGAQLNMRFRDKNFYFGAGVFGSMLLLDMDYFSVWGRASLDWTSYDWDDQISIGLSPILQLWLSDNISLYARLAGLTYNISYNNTFVINILSNPQLGVYVFF